MPEKKRQPDESIRIAEDFQATHTTLGEGQRVFEIATENDYVHLTYEDAQNLIRWLRRQMAPDAERDASGRPYHL